LAEEAVRLACIFVRHQPCHATNNFKFVTNTSSRIWRFNITNTKAHHWTQFWASSSHLPSSQLIFLITLVTLSYFFPTLSSRHFKICYTCMHIFHLIIYVIIIVKKGKYENWKHMQLTADLILEVSDAVEELLGYKLLKDCGCLSTRCVIFHSRMMQLFTQYHIFGYFSHLQEHKFWHTVFRILLEASNIAIDLYVLICF